MKSSFYQEIQSERDVTGDNFSKGEINFNWTMSENAYFNPHKSYIRLRFSLTKSDGATQLEKSDNIAPNMFLVDNLFQQMSMSINNTVVSEISDYVAQVASLKHRMYKSEEHMNNLLSITMFSDAYGSERQSQVIAPDSTKNQIKSYQVFENQAGTVGVVVDGTMTLGTANTTLDVGDTVILDDGREFPIITKTNTETFATTALKAELVATSNGTWGIKRSVRHYDDKIWHNRSLNRGKTTFEALYSLPMGFFDIDEFVPGCQGLFNLKLTPQASEIMKLCAVESLSGVDIAPTNNYRFNVESMNLYLLKGLGAPVTNKTINLKMRESRCQSQNLTTNSLHQKTFQVHPNTQELTLAFQEPGASIVSNAFSAAKFKSNNSNEQKLTRFYINYGGKQLPSPIPDIEFSSSKDFLVQRYVESLNYTNALHSPEPLRKWIERGPYYHFSGYSESEKEDRVYVSSQFSAFSGNNPNMLLFDHYLKNVTISISGSKIQDVKCY